MKIQENMKTKKNKKNYKSLILLGILFIATLVIIKYSPDNSEKIIDTSISYFIQMAKVFPAVLILMGLFSVWISKEFVMKHLGESSGVKGIIVAFILGALPTGPMFVAFPMAQGLIRKGASITNIVIFLSAWACIKLPQELIELQFLGIEFMLARLGMTIIFVTIMGIIINKLMNKNQIN
ncbi:MAG: permease [Candidatus Marinimicrobia bacterium]|nr:permease [Candidatus Neomarinimicrobiota bacterium]